jgi:dephospho-CoA kinase
MIIGITGTIGAGKGTVVEYLKTKGFTHFSARDVFNEEIARRGMLPGRDSMVVVANEMRAKYGPGFFAQRAVAFAQENGKDVVAESIRSLGEAEHIKSHGGVLWAVDADIHKRYERISKRMSETDKVSFEKFKADEELEMHNTEPAKQNIAGVMQMADITLANNGTQEELFAQVKKALSGLN